MAEHRALSEAPLLLALETATAAAGVALLRGEQTLGQLQGEAGQQHAERLLPMIDELLSGLATPLAAIEAFALSIGPGAFTSLRIGLATVKGLAFGSDCPVVPIPTLEALALSALQASARRGEPLEPGSVLVPALDARRGDVYAAAYRIGQTPGDDLAPLLEGGVYPPSALLDVLRGGGRVVGEGAPVVQGELRPEQCVGFVCERESITAIDAACVGRLGQRGLLRGEGVAAVDLVPRYVRRAEAEALRISQQCE